MLLITCPYCEAARPELEFAYAGEAHLVRPADPSKLRVRPGSQAAQPMRRNSIMTEAA